MKMGQACFTVKNHFKTSDRGAKHVNGEPSSKRNGYLPKFGTKQSLQEDIARKPLAALVLCLGSSALATDTKTSAQAAQKSKTLEICAQEVVPLPTYIYIR